VIAETGEGTKPAPTRADQLGFDTKQLDAWKKELAENPEAKPPDAQAWSNKSRNPADYPSQRDFLDQVGKDANELLDKYSGEVDVRSSKFGNVFRNKKINVSKVTLVFDLVFDEAVDETIRSELRKAVVREVSEVSDQIQVEFR
jgi:hypothetical protein